jgi:hypothetical protein
MSGVSNFIQRQNGGLQTNQDPQSSVKPMSRRQVVAEQAKLPVPTRTTSVLRTTQQRSQTSPEQFSVTAPAQVYSTQSKVRQQHHSLSPKFQPESFADSDIGSDFDNTLVLQDSRNGEDENEPGTYTYAGEKEEYNRQHNTILQQMDLRSQDNGSLPTRSTVSIVRNGSVRGNGVDVSSEFPMKIQQLMQNPSSRRLLTDDSNENLRSQGPLPRNNRFGGSQIESEITRVPPRMQHNIGSTNDGQHSHRNKVHNHQNEQPQIIQFPQQSSRNFVHGKQDPERVVEDHFDSDHSDIGADIEDSDDDHVDNGLNRLSLQHHGLFDEYNGTSTDDLESDGQTAPEPTTPRGNKRTAVELDYDEGTLSNMKYAEIKDLPFDENPKASVSVILENFTGPDKSFKAIIEHFETVDKNLQTQYFAQMSLKEWEDAGDWFLERFGNVISKLKDVRHKKRTISSKYEDELASREEAVQREVKDINEVMEQMRQGGQGVLQTKKRR